ncbi:hypothetical protein BV20DRAFT_957568 [Pilatotrama ljubarskyi]|nr:hypothetical protein BV20DRAFT_957568 [Pilatotrama ljubarskyi]
MLRRGISSIIDLADPEGGNSGPQPNLSGSIVRASEPSALPLPFVSPGSAHESVGVDIHGESVPDDHEYLAEKRDTISRCSDDGGETSSASAYFSTALSALPLAPGLVSGSGVGAGTAQARRLHFSWDEPPPTPEFHPICWRTSEVVAYQRSRGGEGNLMAVSENFDSSRDPTHVAVLAAEVGESEVDLGQPPEYSRY